MFKHLRAEAFLMALIITLVPLWVYSQSEGGSPPAAEAPLEPASQEGELEKIRALYYAGKYKSVIDKSNTFLTKYRLTIKNLRVLFFKAASHSRLGQIEHAIRAYQKALPHINKLNNVKQRRYAFVFFRTGALHRQRRRHDTAIKMVERGLRLEPQNVYYQILLGQLFGERGDKTRALKHFKELLASSIPTSEERAVLRIKIARLGNAGADASTPRVDLSAESLYPGLSFAIVPLNYPKPDVSVRDICLLLESKWHVRCRVEWPITLDEDRILDKRRNQYSGDRILRELERKYSEYVRSYRLVVALVGRDLFAQKLNYVFSWQNIRNGVGVVSAYRFRAGLEDFYEPEIIATRRLGIQFLSTTGRMLGIKRPTKPYCPMAYPHDFHEFQQKASKLCESTVRQRDKVLKAKGGPPMTFGAQKSGEIRRVYRAYHFD